jgi:hypothetical protein
MKTDVIRVTSSGSGMEKALEQAEKVALYKGLPRKNALHLRLLTEEAMGLLRSITGDVDGLFWIEDDGDTYELHLKVDTLTDEDQRRQLLSVASSGKNEAAKGLMGKIRSFFEPAEGIPVMFDMTMADAPGWADFTWSLSAYQVQLQEMVEQKRNGADEAWDELEKSVVTHVADDVKVGIRGREVEMVILKKMA